MYRAVINMAGPVKRAKVLNRSTVLRRNGRSIDLAVNDIHEVLIVEY